MQRNFFSPSELISLFNSGKFQEVEYSARAMIAASSTKDPQTLKILGTALIRLGKLEAALNVLQDTLQVSANDPELLNNYGVLLKQLGRREEAVDHLLRAARLSPQLPATYNNLGNLLAEAGDTRQAFVAYSILLEYGAINRLVLLRLSDHLYQSGKFQRCISLLEGAPELLEKDIDLLTLLGNAQKAMSLLSKAEASYKKVLSLDSGNWKAASNLAVCYREQGKLLAAVSEFKKAASLNPESAEVHTNLAVVLKDIGRTKEAFDAYSHAVSLNPELWIARSNLLFAMNYEPSTSPQAYLAKAVQYGIDLARSVGEKRFVASGQTVKARPQRIGFVTGDLWSHPVGYFLYTLVSSLSTRNLDLTVYITKPKEDGFTRRILPFFKGVRKLFGLTDQEAAALVKSDRIDVLIDLSGHTAGNRLPVFQYRPAPLQITWLGYFASTGLQEMDYIVGDKVVTPKSEQSHFVEKIYQMPEVYFCYTVPVDAVPVNGLPMLTNNYVTFGCFNNLSKIGAQVKALWAQLLKKVPTSRLFLKYKQLVDTAVREGLQKDFVALGIPPERLILEGSSHLNDYYRSYNRVDICLDPFPYPGGTTTIDALWMGAPTVMLAGDRFVSRNGETIARAVGLSPWVAKTKEDYVALAVKWAGKPKELAVLRKGLRAKLEASPLMDGKRFAADFQDALNAMWDERMATLHEPGVVTHISDAVETKPTANQQAAPSAKPHTRPRPVTKPQQKPKAKTKLP